MICYEEPIATLYQGHALNELAMLPDNFVDCVMTSPPYWGLRTYKTELIDWGDWRGELGLEPTIELYISHLIQIFNEVKRVLKKTGTCWVNIDDSYYGGGFGHSTQNAEEFKKAYPKQASVFNYDSETRALVGGVKQKGLLPAKSLCLIPQRFAIAMVEQGWILRNDICWDKPNPMPESVKDRFTGSWEHLYFFVKSKKYWFEQQFERSLWFDRDSRADGTLHPSQGKSSSGEYAIEGVAYRADGNRNKRDVWEITTQPYPEAHFATFPEKLCETPILAGCPGAICKKCGKAREKVYEKVGLSTYEKMGGKNGGYKKVKEEAERRGETGVGDTRDANGNIVWYERTPTEFAGYTDCGCNAGFESGIVLDPFAGSGTVGAVAKRLGRKYIGIELSEQYCKLHKKRLQGIPLPMELVA